MNYNLLVEAWKKYLKESPNDSAVEHCLFVHQTNNVKTAFIYDGSKMLDTIFSPEYLDRLKTPFAKKRYARFDPERRLVTGGALVATIDISRPDAKDGPCAGAYEVIGSAVNKLYQGKKLGTLLYYIAMEMASPHALTSDRLSITPAAKRVWASFNKKNNIERVPSKRGEYLGGFDDIDNPKTKPKDDDCRVYGEPDVDAAYSAKESPASGHMATMTKNHKEFLRAIISNTKRSITADFDSLPDWYPLRDKGFVELGNILFYEAYHGDR